ncbi:unnamed protein product [Cylicocyclus nassatus]|uniref:Uncharacterized protein n=1 Tax=Cylicocyclus nassatus TaxID=53992 RepID=A0AA36GTC3_CYLNA|nr:unnamed protein product [Cylicocyclus nassatus]
MPLAGRLLVPAVVSISGPRKGSRALVYLTISAPLRVGRLARRFLVPREEPVDTATYRCSIFDVLAAVRRSMLRKSLIGFPLAPSMALRAISAAKNV